MSWDHVGTSEGRPVGANEDQEYQELNTGLFDSYGEDDEAEEYDAFADWD